MQGKGKEGPGRFNRQNKIKPTYAAGRAATVKTAGKKNDEEYDCCFHFLSFGFFLP